MALTKTDLSALSDVLDMDIDENDFEFSEELNNTEELVFEEAPKKEKPVVKDTKDYSVISDKHWLLEKEDIQKMLDTLSGIIIKSGEVVNKSVHVYRKDDKLIFSYNANDIQGQFELTLLNTNNLISVEKSYVLDYQKLTIAVKNSESKVVLKDKVETLVVELLGAEIELENYLGVDENSFNSLSKIDFTTLKQKDLDYTSFTNFLKTVSYSDKLSMRPEDRKVRVIENEAFSNYALIIVNYKNVNLDNFSIRLMDVFFLLKVLSASKGKLSLAQTDSNNYLIGENFVISLPMVYTEDLNYVKRICGDLRINSQFTIETVQFYKKLNTLRQFTGNRVSTHVYTKDGTLFVLAKTINQREIKFKIVENLNPDINIDSHLPIMSLMNTYRLFKDYPQIDVSVTDNRRFIFGVEAFRLIFGDMN